MNDVTIFIYLVFFIMVASATFAFMWKMMSSTLAEMDRKPVTNYGEVMKAYTPHPEEPKDGEEVMGVTFKSCESKNHTNNSCISVMLSHRLFIYSPCLIYSTFN